MSLYRIGKTYISNTNPKDAIARIENDALTGKKGYICVSNMRMVRFANKNPEYKRLMDESLMNLPDGTPLVWMGKLWGLSDLQKTCGPRLFDDMLKIRNNGLKHFLLGDTEETLTTLVNKYVTDFNSNIVGTYSPPFKDVDDFDYPMIADLIKNTGANIIWVAMRAPKQDQFARRLVTYLDNGILIGVGRAFRFSTGEFVLPEGNLISKLGLIGFVSRRTSFLHTLKWHIESSFYLFFYCCQIILWRILGRNPSF